MASAWAQLSKEEQAAFLEKGYTKKSYNDQYGKGGEPAPGSGRSAQELIDTYTPNAAAASQQEAVERSQSWADLSKDEKEELQTADPNVTKKSYNQSTGYRAEEVAIQKQDADPLNTKYSEMSDTYKQNTDKATHKQSRKDSGTYTNDNMEAKQDADPLNTKYSEMSDTYRGNTSKKDHKQSRVDAGTYTNDRLDSYKVDSLDNFDITNTGRGRKEGQYRLSVDELNRLNAAGFSKEEIANRAMTGEWSDAKKGTKAQKLLDSWMAEFIEDTQPGGDGEDTLPGGGEDTLPGGGEDTLPGGGEDTLPGGGEDTLPGGGEDTLPGGDGNDDIDVIGDDNNVIGDDGIINEDIQNTNIEDSFNGGTIGDITQGGTINGDNNTINNTVDNSNNSRYYGGSNTVWNINNSNESPNTGFALGGGNYTGGVDTTLSDLTTLGYGKPDDSPASNAQFVDMYQTLNSDAQKKYENVGSDTANKYIEMARANNPVNFQGIQQTLSGYYNDEGQFVPGTAQNFYDRAVARQTQFMGDYANFRPPEYIFPDPPAPIEDNLDEIAEDAMDF